MPLATVGRDDGPDSDSQAFASAPLPNWPAGYRFAGFNDAAYLNGGDGSRWDTGVHVNDTLTWAHAAGANSHRIVADWRALEPEPGVVRRDLVTRMRRLADGFAARGGKVLVTLALAPPWARDPMGNCRSCHGPPSERAQTMAAWDRYVELMARTFPDAAAFEVWNEPNFRHFWGPRPDPARYARLVRRTAHVLRRTAPGAKVLAGSVLAVPDDVPEHGIMRSSTFLAQAFAAGLGGSYDAISWHAYPFQQGGQLEQLDADSVFRRAIADVQTAIDAADPQARQWVTETGITTTGEGVGVSVEAQRSGLAAILNLLDADRRIDAVYVHRLFESLSDAPNSRERGFGIAVPTGGGSGRAKPAFCMLRAAAGGPTADPSGGCPALAADRGEVRKQPAAGKLRAKRRRARARAARRARAERRARADRRSRDR